MRFVTVPGIDGSDDAHWQSHWEAEWGRLATRISPSSWTEPDLDDWLQAIGACVARADSDVVLVAHSLGCLAAARWASERPERLLGVFLVAPPDERGSAFPTGAAPTFAVIEAAPLPVPALVVFSENDPYCAPEAAQRLAARWTAPLVGVGRLGHINSASGLGRWEAGRGLLTAFTAGMGAIAPTENS